MRESDDMIDEFQEQREILKIFLENHSKFFSKNKILSKYDLEELKDNFCSLIYEMEEEEDNIFYIQVINYIDDEYQYIYEPNNNELSTYNHLGEMLYSMTISKEVLLPETELTLIKTLQKA